jgi:hypothetical protein
MAVSRGLAERANSGAVEGVEQVRPVLLLLLLVWQAGRQAGGRMHRRIRCSESGAATCPKAALPAKTPTFTPPLLPPCLPVPPACPLQGPYRAVGQALEVIPRTLAQNCGANVIRTLTKLRAKHADAANCTYGINGEGWMWGLEGGSGEGWSGAAGGRGGRGSRRAAMCGCWLLAGVGCPHTLSHAPHLPTNWPASDCLMPCLPGLLCLARPPTCSPCRQQRRNCGHEGAGCVGALPGQGADSEDLH